MAADAQGNVFIAGEAHATRVAEAPFVFDDVKLLAEQEYCEVVHLSTRSKPASFRKYDAASNTHVYINVWFDSSTACIEVEHPRQGKMKAFRTGLTKRLMREIFRSPRECAGYSDLKRSGEGGQPSSASSTLAVGDVVQVNGYGLRGCAKLTGQRDYQTGLVKIQFADGGEYRVDARQLTKVRRVVHQPRPDPRRTLKCQSLPNEARLQLKRLDRELAALQEERRALLALQEGLHRDAAPPSPPGANVAAEHCPESPSSFATGLSTSPSSFTGMDLRPRHGSGGSAGPFEFAEANLESILSDSGAFAAPLQPELSNQTPHQTLHQAQNHSEARMILPPLDYPGFFND